MEFKSHSLRFRGKTNENYIAGYFYTIRDIQESKPAINIDMGWLKREMYGIVSKSFINLGFILFFPPQYKDS